MELRAMKLKEIIDELKQEIQKLEQGISESKTKYQYRFEIETEDNSEISGDLIKRKEFPEFSQYYIKIDDGVDDVSVYLSKRQLEVVAQAINNALRDM